MLFFPFGVLENEVVDPERLAKEYQEAARTASDTSHYQWKKGAFPDLSKISDSAAAHVMTTAMNPLIGARGASHPNTSDILPRDPILKTHKDSSGAVVADRTPHSDLLQIPYNRGWKEDEATVQKWNSEYPELLFISFSYQFIRDYARTLVGKYPNDQASGRGAGWDPTKGQSWSSTQNVYLRIRAKVRITVDGAHIPGTGPFSLPVYGNQRGTGYEGPDYRSTVCAIVPVAAGNHRVSVVASVGPHTVPVGGKHTFSNLNEKVGIQPEDPPDQGVTLAYRRMTCIRFPKGTTFGG
tara:strand:- start:12776 stop:13663 length:888 start_codon:yes stop_codon:yes gene_type:complete